MATKKNTDEGIVINIKPIDVQSATLTIVGDSPLIMHKWSEKAKREMLETQMKKAKKGGHDAKDPVRDFIESMYWLDGEPEEKTEAGFVEAIKNGARFGFPSIAFKASAVAAGFRAGVTKNKVVMYGAFYIPGDFIEIQGIPHPREDMVRVSNGNPDIRYRGQFDDWRATFTVKYNASVVSLEQLLSLFNLGGFACGLGEWRPERGGSFGMFHVE